MENDRAEEAMSLPDSLGETTAALPVFRDAVVIGMQLCLGELIKTLKEDRKRMFYE